MATISAPVNSSPYAAFLAQMDAVASQQPASDNSSAGSLKTASAGLPSREARPRGRSQPAGQASRFRASTAEAAGAEPRPQQPAVAAAKAAPQPESRPNRAPDAPAPAGSRLPPPPPVPPQQQQQQQQQRARGNARAPEARQATLRRFVSDGAAALGSAANIAARSAPAARAADPYSAFHLVSCCMSLRQCR